MAWAQAKGALVEGIELDARAIAAAETAGIALASQSITDQAKIAPGAYGLIAAFDVFEHMTVDQIKDHLAAIALLLKTGGLLALRYPNGQSPFGLAPQHGDVTHITPLSRVKIEQMATRHGFYTVRYAGAAEPRGSGIGRIGRMFRKSIRRIFGGVLNFVFGQTIIWDSVVTHVLRRD